MWCCIWKESHKKAHFGFSGMLNALKARYCNKHLCRFKVFNEFLWYLAIKTKIKLFDLYVSYFEKIFIYKVLGLFPPSSWVTSATYLKSFLRQTVSNEFILPNIHEWLHCQIILNKIDVTNNSLYFRISNGKGWAGHIQKAAWWLFSIVMGCIVFLMQCGFAFLEAGSVR